MEQMSEVIADPVNAEVDDGSEIAKLMKYFKISDPYDMSQGALSKRVHYLT